MTSTVRNLEGEGTVSEDRRHETKTTANPGTDEPEPEETLPPLDDETRATITRIIKSCVYGDLATISADGTRPSVRPVCAFLQEDMTILVPSHSQTRKIAEIANNPNVEICFVDKEHWQVRAAGTAELVEDKSAKKTLIETTLNPKLWHGFFPEGEHDERFVRYRIHPESFEWMKEWELKYRRVDLS